MSTPNIVGTIPDLLDSCVYDNGSVTFRLTGNTNLRTCIDQNDVTKVLTVSGAWYISSNGYAFLTHYIKGTHYLHRIIVGEVLEGFVVDHINGKRLDNRSSNLQLVTSRQNVAKARNVSKFGVNITLTEAGQYRVRVIFAGTTIHLGRYDTNAQAKAVRNHWYVSNNLTPPTD